MSFLLQVLHFISRIKNTKKSVYNNIALNYGHIDSFLRTEPGLSAFLNN